MEPINKVFNHVTTKTHSNTKITNLPKIPMLQKCTCGGSAKLVCEADGKENKYCVKCQDCGAGITMCESELIAAQEWNALVSRKSGLSGLNKIL